MARSDLHPFTFTWWSPAGRSPTTNGSPWQPPKASKMQVYTTVLPTFIFWYMFQRSVYKIAYHLSLILRFFHNDWLVFHQPHRWGKCDFCTTSLPQLETYQTQTILGEIYVVKLPDVIAGEWVCKVRDLNAHCWVKNVARVSKVSCFVYLGYLPKSPESVIYSNPTALVGSLRCAFFRAKCVVERSRVSWGPTSSSTESSKPKTQIKLHVLALQIVV